MHTSIFTRYALLVGAGILVAGCGESTNPRGARKLAINIDPATVTAGQVLSIEVEVLDANDGIVTGHTVPVTLSLGSNPGGGAATLLGTVTGSAVNGVVL